MSRPMSMSYLCDLFFIFSLVSIVNKNIRKAFFRKAGCVRAMIKKGHILVNLGQFEDELHPKQHENSNFMKYKNALIRSLKQTYMFFVNFSEYVLLFLYGNTDEERKKISNSKSSASGNCSA